MPINSSSFFYIRRSLLLLILYLFKVEYSDPGCSNRVKEEAIMLSCVSYLQDLEGNHHVLTLALHVLNVFDVHVIHLWVFYYDIHIY